MHCSGGKFSDPTAGLRECVTTCTEGLFGEPLSGKCLSAISLIFAFSLSKILGTNPKRTNIMLAY